MALLAAMTILALGLPSGPLVAGDELADTRADQRALEIQITNQEAIVARLQRSQASLTSRIASTSAALDETVSDLRVARREIAALRGAIREVRTDYEQLVAEIERLREDLVQAEAQETDRRAELLARKEQLAARIRAAYEASQRSPFEALVSGASFSDLLVEASAQLDAGEQDRALARQISRDRESLLVLAASIKARQAQAQTLQQEAAVQEAALDSQLRGLRRAERTLGSLQRRTQAVLAQQRAAYRELAKDEARSRTAIAATERAQRKLKARIERLIEAQLAEGGIPSDFSGTMRWPMPGVVSQDYGCTGFPWEPPRGNCAHFHNGIDIVAPYGTPVRAAAEGRVVFIGYNPYDDPRDPAWIVIIAHSSSIQTWYAHLQPRRPVRIGQLVQAGTVIGYEGNTGRSTGAHLDWRVMRSGEFVNPRLFL